MSRSKTTQLLFVCFPLFLTVLTVSFAAAQQDPTFTTIDVPGAIQTEVSDINFHGDIVGTFVDSAGVTHGFVQVFGGSFQTLDAPHSTATIAHGINTNRMIAGWYIDGAGVTHGFKTNLAGAFATIDPDGSTLTIAWGISERSHGSRESTIVGSYTGPNGTFHGFKGKQTIDAPNGALMTTITGLDEARNVAGFYTDASGVQHGFTDAHGIIGLGKRKFMDVTVPGAAAGLTELTRINQNGEIVGFFSTSTAVGPFTGFRRSASHKFYRVAFPGASDTRCIGINDKGVIVGQYTDSAGVVHGFQMTP